MKSRKRSAKSPEQQFLETYDASEFEHPSLAVDVVLLSVRDGELIVALVRRDEHPEQGKWALPGGFVGFDEPLDKAANRILSEKAGLTATTSACTGISCRARWSRDTVAYSLPATMWAGYPVGSRGRCRLR